MDTQITSEIGAAGAYGAEGTEQTIRESFWSKAAASLEETVSNLQMAADRLTGLLTPVLGDATPDPDVSAIRERVRELQELPPPPERRRLRVRAGVSLLDVAAAVGVSHTAISAWERGLRTPNRRLLPRYLEVLSILREAER